MTEQPQTETTEPVKKNRHRSSLLFFALMAAAVFAFSYRPSIDAVYCKTDTAADNPDVIMLATAWCPYCYQARKYFVHNKISYCEYDIEDNGTGEQMYSQLNSQSNSTGMPLGIPVLYIGDYLFSGFEKSRIEHALTSLKNHDTTH